MKTNKQGQVCYLYYISRYESNKVAHALCMAGFEILPSQCFGIAGDLLRKLASDHQTEKEIRTIIGLALTA